MEKWRAKFFSAKGRYLNFRIFHVHKGVPEEWPLGENWRQDFRASMALPTAKAWIYGAKSLGLETKTEPKEFSWWLQYYLKALLFTPLTPCAKRTVEKLSKFFSASIFSVISEKVNGCGLTTVRSFYRPGTWKRRFYIQSFNGENGFTAPEKLLEQSSIPKARSYSTSSSKISWRNPGGELGSILRWVHLMQWKVQ